jgi:hypothetical protein
METDKSIGPSATNAVTRQAIPLLPRDRAARDVSGGGHESQRSIAIPDDILIDVRRHWYGGKARMNQVTRDSP